MAQSEEYKRRVNSFQKSILVVQLFLMIIGGLIFTLAVISRPILRITKAEFIPTVRWIVNVMVGAGLTQIAAAAYDVFSGCWKLIWPIYLGIAMTALTVLLELTAIGSSIYLYTKSEVMVNEELVHPWYWVECLKFQSCHASMLQYIHWFILPQVIMAAITVILQCVGIILLGRLVKTVAEHFRVLHEAQEKYHEEYEEKIKWKEQDKKLKAHSSSINNIESEETVRTPRVKFSDQHASSSKGGGGGEDEMEMHTTTYTAQIHVECATPCSILQEDHGYVAGSRVSLDMDKL